MKRALSVASAIILLICLLSTAQPAVGAAADAAAPTGAGLPLIGDADADGNVTIVDATCIQRKMAGLPVRAFDEKAADSDEDGKVTIVDATAIQRWLAHLDTGAKNIGKALKVSYSPYAGIVSKLEAAYGAGRKNTDPGSGTKNYLIGVPIVRLIDFDSDGCEELLCAYGSRNFANTQEVYTIVNGKAVLIYSGSVNFEGGVGPYVEYLDVGKAVYLLTDSVADSNVRGSWLQFDGDSTTVVFSFESKEVYSNRTVTRSCSINGEATTEKDFTKRIQAFLSKGVDHKLFLYPSYATVKYPQESGDALLNETEKTISLLQ